MKKDDIKTIVIVGACPSVDWGRTKKTAIADKTVVTIIEFLTVIFLRLATKGMIVRTIIPPISKSKSLTF